MKEIILKWALKNAIEHDGKAQVGAVIPKVIGEKPELRQKIKEVAKEVTLIVKEVNSLSIEKQKEKLKEIAPELLEQKKHEERQELPDLPNAQYGKVVLRLPPEPSGYMHLGHAMSGLINFMYKQKYNGKLWLRFEDTNPKKVKEEYFESFRNGYRWLGIVWDEEKKLSDDMAEFYKYAEKLIKDGNAYVCTCDEKTIKKNRFEGKECKCKKRTVEENLQMWADMLNKKYREGEAVLRLNGNMKDVEASMRDPNLLRIIDTPHIYTGTKYSVWPVYDYAVVIEDYLCKITHVLRSQEFHVTLQDYLRKILGFPPVNIIQYARFNFKGTPFAKRKIRPLIEQGIIKSWDDPRLPTISAIQRRGFLPEAIKQFTIAVGYSKSEHTYDWEMFYAFNRKLLDPISKRYFFVPNPVQLKVEKAPQIKVELKYHPEKDLGLRQINTTGTFLISSDDAKEIKKGELFRLKDLYNVKLTKKTKSELVGEYAGKELIEKTKKIQWVPVEHKIPVQVIVPDVLFDENDNYNKDSLKVIEGFAEPSVENIAIGQVVQFERFGFVRLDSKEKILKFIFAHK